ncbi:MAG TPA: hypothetical protein VHV54_10095 [Candidatus Binatia bacterium]|nr:hypothetical protein [Candidatus Binatia bacterium]
MSDPRHPPEVRLRADEDELWLELKAPSGKRAKIALSDELHGPLAAEVIEEIWNALRSSC